MASALSPQSLLAVLSLVTFGCAYVPQPTLPACVNKTPGYTCGVAGHTGKNASAPGTIYRNVTSVDACRIECLQRQSANPEATAPYCNSLAYNSKQKVCNTWQEDISSLGFKADASSPLVFYAFPCFNCLKTCPPTVGSGNILVNPDFENPTAYKQTSYSQNFTNPASPWNDYIGIYQPNVTIANKGYNTSTSLDCYNKECAYTQFMDLCEGSLYSLSFDYLVGTVSQSTSHYYLTAGDLDSFYLPFTPSDVNVWHHYYDTFVARPEDYVSKTSTAAFNFYIYGDEYTQVFIDNLSIQPAKVATPPASAVSVLQNGGFESGQLAPWTSISDEYSNSVPAIVNQGYKSDYSVGCQNTTNDVTRCNLLSQAFSLQRYTTYVVSMAYKKMGSTCNNQYRNGVQLLLTQPEQDSGIGTNSSTTYSNGTFNSNLGQWITTSRQFIATGNITHIEATISNYRGCSVLVDSFSLKALS